MSDKDEILTQLGRTQTVEDIQAAYHRIYLVEVRTAARLKRIKNDAQRTRVEVELFLDDLKAITGLPFSSKLFWRIASLTIARRLARRRLLNEEAEMQSPLDWDSGMMGDLP